MYEFSNVDFSKLSTEQMDALLNCDLSSAPQQATFPEADFESTGCGSFQDSTHLMDETFGFWATGSDPREANLDDFHSAGTVYGQFVEASPFGADFFSISLRGLDPSEAVAFQDVMSLQTSDTETVPLDQSDFLMNLETFSGLRGAEFRQESLRQGLPADTMVSINHLAADEELVLGHDVQHCSNLQLELVPRTTGKTIINGACQSSQSSELSKVVAPARSVSPAQGNW